MRWIFKILLFPVVVALTVFVAVCRFLCAFSTMLLSILAFIVFAIALGTMILLGEFWEGIKIAVLAWLISPYGIPLFASFLVELVDGLNSRIKAI
ncbi:MAG: CD1845 family protein [Bacillota bacterium]